VIAISRRQFLTISATLSVSYPLIGVAASSNSGAGAYPITIAILKDAYSEQKLAAQRYVVFSGKAVEASKFDFHACRVCGSTMDEPPRTPCEICNRPAANYRRIERPA
jgi:hypothetical protein